MPYSRKPEDSAPSMKYFRAASWLSRRRRRAMPHSRYSGSDRISSATNSVSRSLAEANISMPNRAKSSRGKISVCSRRRRSASRSRGDPGTVAADDANADCPLPTARSAKSATPPMPKISSKVQKKYAGLSIVIDPMAATVGSALIQFVMVSASAATMESIARNTCTTYRLRRGTTASTRTPTAAPPSSTNRGESRSHSMVGAVIISCLPRAAVRGPRRRWTTSPQQMFHRRLPAGVLGRSRAPASAR